MIRPLETLKSWFVTGAYPTQQQFWDWMDSFFHKEEGIHLDNISGLDEYINDRNKTLIESVGREIDERLDQSPISDVSIDTDPATKRLRLNETSKNLNTGAANTTRSNVPNATAANDGAMPKESAAYTIFCLTRQTLASVSGIPATAANTYIEIAAAATVSFTNTENLKPGYRMHVRVKNMGATGILVTLPGAPIELDSYSPVFCGAGKTATLTLWCYAEGKYSLKHDVPRSNIVLSPNVVTINANGS
jgi:hypothetical protein